MMENTWALIANLHAGNKTSSKQWAQIEACLQAAGIAYVPYYTHKVGHARKYAKKALHDGYRQILVMGGDGTLSEAVDGIMKAGVDTSEVKVALLPLGTGNDWARYWGIDSIQKAVDLLVAGKTSPIDVTCVKYENHARTTRYMINAIGLGFDARVIQLNNRLQHVFMGKSWTYSLAVLLSAIKHRSQVLQFTADTWSETFNCYTVSVGNGVYTGGGLKQTPQATPADGVLDVMVMGALSFGSILKAVKLLFAGRLTEHPSVRYKRITTMRVYSDKPIISEIDGILQPVVKQLTLTIQPGALQFVCP
jgi:diacylglycerol kinase (ATP)